MPEDHPLAGRGKITPRMLRKEAFIAAPEEVSPVLREAILGWLRTGGVTPVIRLETQLQQTIVSLVAEGLGVAIVPASMAKLGMAGVKFRPLENAPEVQHGIAWREGNLNPSLALFLKAGGVA